MNKKLIYSVILLVVIASCTAEDKKLLEYCHEISDASVNIIKMRDDGLVQGAVLALVENSDIADDEVTLNHVRRNVSFAYRYPNMPLAIYKKEVLNHCLSAYRKK